MRNKFASQEMDQLHFRYSNHEYGSIIQTISENYNQALLPVRGRTFNGIDFYQALCAEHQCIQVEIASFTVRHNDFCHGVQATYRLTFTNGPTQRRKGPRNFSSSGFYANHGPTRTRNTTFKLHDGEYIRGLRLNQGEIVDGITFVTNRRELHCGGRGGIQRDAMVYPHPSKYRVVAFAGIFNGVLAQVGYYAKSICWEIVRDYVMLRWLVDMDRASVIDRSRTIHLPERSRRIISTFGFRNHKPSQDQQLGNIAIRWLMTEAPIDVLQIVLSFLF